VRESRTEEGMEQEEHEVYGADIPEEEVDMDADADQQDDQLPSNHTTKVS